MVGVANGSPACSSKIEGPGEIPILDMRWWLQRLRKKFAHSRDVGGPNPFWEVPIIKNIVYGGFLKIRGTILGGPHNKDQHIFGVKHWNPPFREANILRSNGALSLARVISLNPKPYMGGKDTSTPLRLEDP